MSTEPRREIHVTVKTVIQLAKLAGVTVAQGSLEQFAEMLESQVRTIRTMPFGDPLHPDTEAGFNARWNR